MGPLDVSVSQTLTATVFGHTNVLPASFYCHNIEKAGGLSFHEVL